MTTTKIDKIIIEITDASDDSVKVKVTFDPQLPDDVEDVEVTPSIVAMNTMLDAIAGGDDFEEEEPVIVH